MRTPGLLLRTSASDENITILPKNKLGNQKMQWEWDTSVDKSTVVRLCLNCNPACKEFKRPAPTACTETKPHREKLLVFGVRADIQKYLAMPLPKECLKDCIRTRS